MKLFGQSCVDVPEARRTQPRLARPRSGKTPGAIIVGIVVGPKVLIVSEYRLKTRRINPLLDALLLRSAGVEMPVADQIRPAGQLIARPADRGYRQSTLHIQIAGEPPPPYDGIQNSLVIHEAATGAERQLITGCEIQHVGDVIGGDGTVEILVVWILELASESPVPAQCSGAAADLTIARPVDRVHQHCGGLSG